MISTIYDLDTQTSHYYDSGYSGTSSPGSTSSSSCMMGSPSSQTSDSAYNNNFQNLILSDDNVLMSEVQYGDNIYSIQYQQTDEFTNSNCYLEITEQPVDKFRFRYKSEMHGTHGSLMGINNCKTRKTHPTVELRGYNGKALIRCSLYQFDTINPLPHSHQLVVRQNDDDKSDPHELEVNPDRGYRALFIGMGIIHTAKKFIAEALYEKKKKIREFELRRQCTVKEISQLKIDSEKQAKSMNLNQVTLCFEAYKVHDNGSLEQLCKPVFSKPINNMKSALTGELKISRLSACVSSASGGDDLFLLVEKVGKKNIKVKFFEVNDEDESIWEDWGIFTEADVHHQYAIALRTPPYQNKDIDKHVDVFIQLFRPSDGDQSEPVPFKYKPRDFVSSRKRARTCSSSLGSMELPESIVKNFRDDNSGTTISAEYNKEDLISNLCNDQQFSEHIKKNSDELMKILDPSVFDVQLDYDPHLQIDGVSSSNREKLYKSDLKITSKINTILRSVDKTPNSIRDAIKLILRIFNEANTNGNDILHNIIQSNEIGEAMKLLKIIDKLQIYDVLQLQNKYGDTCLHVACTYDRPAYIKPLINLGIDPNVQNAQGNTALHIAVRESMAMCVTKILEKQNYTKLSKSLNIDLANDNGLTPLHLAVMKKNLDMVKNLMENGNASVKISISKDGNNVLHLAVKENNDGIVRYLLSNTSVKINQPNTSGFTPLSLAQSMGKDAIKIVKILLEKGATNNTDHKFKVELKKLKNSQDDSNSADDSNSDSDDEKSLRIDESHITEEKMDLNYTEIDYFDDIALKKLIEILKINQKWIKLAKILNLDDYLYLWKSPETMLRHINKYNIKMQQVIDALNQCKEYAAIECIEEMKKRYRI